MLYPWPTYRNRWNLQVVEVRLDGEVSADAIDDEHCIVNPPLDEWDAVTLKVRCENDEPELIGNLRCHLMVSAARSLFRQAYSLTEVDTGVFVGEITLHHDDLAGVAVVGAKYPLKSWAGSVRSAVQWNGKL